MARAGHLEFSILATGEPRHIEMEKTSRKEVCGAAMTTGASSLAARSPLISRRKPRDHKITEEVAVYMNSLQAPRHPACRQWSVLQLSPQHQLKFMVVK
jgi:hypothetical protein